MPAEVDDDVVVPIAAAVHHGRTHESLEVRRNLEATNRTRIKIISSISRTQSRALIIIGLIGRKGKSTNRYTRALACIRSIPSRGPQSRR